MELKVFDLGLTDFSSLENKQREVFQQVLYGDLNSALVLSSLKPVITLGRRAIANNILVDQSQLEKNGIALEKISRGGDVTYHGPGQLMAYPIFNLNYFKKDIHWFLRGLEERIAQTIGSFGIECRMRTGLTGVWVGDSKIAAIGLSLSHWISYYGLAININKDDLDNFSLIRPCGMDIMVTSMESVLKRSVDIASVKEILIRRMQKW